ncbi:MarC family protein [Chitinibacteraceae bacterium HSL-7]
MDQLFSALQAMLLVPLALLPVINPLGGAPLIATLARGVSDSTMKKLARQVAINAFIVMVVAMLIGTYVLDLFGISLPIVRVAGGLLVAATAWRMLSSQPTDNVQQVTKANTETDLSDAEIAQKAFFPLTFPLTTGPGTIATAIALGAKLPSQPALYAVGVAIDTAGAALTAAAIYLIYRNASRLLDKIGEIGDLVLTRLMAFILLCIGIQILWTGWAELNGLH